VLVNVTGGLDMTLLEVDEAANAISDQVDPEANIIFGAAFDPSLEGVIRVSVVATGMDGASMAAIEPARPRMTARAPVMAPVATPEAHAEPEPVRAEAWTMEARDAEPVLFETQAEAEEEQAALLFDEPEIEIASEPVIKKIVDPMVEDDEEPLVADVHHDEPPRKSGWLSLFGGRQRYEAPAHEPAPQRAAAGGGAAAAPQVMEEPEIEDNDDLEIPSFLRRLAN
jgi:cell division protein FtsZ